MTVLQTPPDIFPVLSTMFPLMGKSQDPYNAALISAANLSSPVDRAIFALEAAYGAVKNGGVTSPADIPVFATLAGQLGFLATNYGWHGKAQRGADILAAMRTIVEEGKTAAEAGGPDVDPSFAPAAAPAAG